ncbi:DUF1259 domain-containing protein [Lentibacillus sp. N15]|uniref:DUF1259 domain-containing protein n=1 Tax=Lentibacillus songyuanensis TaxID=3136161 RepID=UPI0031BBCC05
MKKIIPILVLSLFLLQPAGMAYGAESPECLHIKNLFVDNAKQVDNVCKVEISRKNLNVSLEGEKVSPEMLELAFGANFERVGNTSVVTGEFALFPKEVNPVIDAFRKGDIEISALHNHWFEQPEVLYLHFQGSGDPKSLAETVKSAIDAATQQSAS